MPRDSRVALVQLSNGYKIILVQVSAMSSTLLSLYPFPVLTTLY